MRKTQLKFNIVGITPDGIYVVDNVFKIFDSLGMPLDEIFNQCKNRNLLPSWIHFYIDAKNGKWSDETIINRLESTIPDIYGKAFSDAVIERVNLYIESQRLGD